MMEFLRVYQEALQYAAFSSGLSVCAGLETWISRNSTKSDRRRRWPANAALTVLNIAVLGALPVSVLATAEFAQSRSIGLMNMGAIPTLAAIIRLSGAQSAELWSAPRHAQGADLVARSPGPSL